MKIPVIYRPHLSNFNAPLGLSAPKGISNPNDKKRRPTEVELVSVMLIAGINWVEEATWSLMANHPVISERVSSFSRKRILTNYAPLPKEDGEEYSETTLDYELEDARDLIEACFDIEWLRLCQARDSRREIGKWTSERITEIEEKLKRV